MTPLQIVLLVLTIATVLWQLLVVASIAGAVSKYGSVTLTNDLRLMLLVSIGIETLFVLSITDNL